MTLEKGGGKRKAPADLAIGGSGRIPRRRADEQVEKLACASTVSCLGADGAGDHPAATADEHGGRCPGDPVQGRHGAVTIEDNRRRHTPGLHPVGDRLLVLLVVDKEHGELLAPALLVQCLDRRGQLPRAVRSPARPEVKEHHASVELGERQRRQLREHVRVGRPSAPMTSARSSVGCAVVFAASAALRPCRSRFSDIPVFVFESSVTVLCESQ
jgi:hypothetical protein